MLWHCLRLPQDAGAVNPPQAAGAANPPQAAGSIHQLTSGLPCGNYKPVLHSPATLSHDSMLSAGACEAHE